MRVLRHSHNNFESTSQYLRYSYTKISRKKHFSRESGKPTYLFFVAKRPLPKGLAGASVEPVWNPVIGLKFLQDLCDN